MNASREEIEIAYRVRQVLDDGAGSLDAATLDRLHQARQRALQRHRAEALAPVWLNRPILAGAGADPGESGLMVWIRRFGLVVPLLALVVGVVGIRDWQRDRFVTDLADVDFAVLLDDTPIDTYAHQGFEVYLHSNADDL